MATIVHEETRTVMRRDGFPSDVVKVCKGYARTRIVVISLLLGWFLIPWLAIGLNYGFNRGVCSSQKYRSNWYLDGLCAGTYLRQIHEVPWYLNLWDQDDQNQNHSASAHSHSDIPPHIARLMSSHARLDNPILAIGHQLSKAMTRSAEMAGHELSSSVCKCSSRVRTNTQEP